MTNSVCKIVKELENSIMMAKVMGYQIEVQHDTIWLWRDDLKETIYIVDYRDRGMNLFGISNSIENQKDFSTIEELEKELIEYL